MLTGNERLRPIPLAPLKETPVPKQVPPDRGPLSILVVDDDRALREASANFLKLEGHQVRVSGNGAEALEMVRRERFDLVLLDLYMTPVSGMDILSATVRENRRTLVAVMTGNPCRSSSIRALQAGAWEYLVKPFSPSHLEVLMARATHAIDSTRERRRRLETLERASSHSDLVTCLGVSPSFRRAVETAQQVARTTASVMLSGPSGTGKEVLAQMIHSHSARASKPWVAVNCAALPEPLLESEMFGHRRGAFTGADRDKPGLLEVADGGTLFLDELTEMTPRLQAKLLRVLQDGVVRRVGSEHENAKVSVRFVSATNTDLREAINSGTLRKDLFYRLRVVLIQLPPLRERVEDIEILANHFLRTAWERYRRPDEPMPKLSVSALEVLKSRPWHGNVRELQNVLENLAALLEPAATVKPDDIPFYDDESEGGEIPLPLSLLDDGYYSARDRLVACFEKAYLSRLVGRAGGNMSKAARIASMDRTTLYRLVDRHRITDRPLDESVID
jgi:DNA-binding NtrC family response regulator